MKVQLLNQLGNDPCKHGYLWLQMNLTNPWHEYFIQNIVKIMHKRIKFNLLRLNRYWKYFNSICFTITRSESYSVLSPFLSKLRYAYRWNRKNMFYLLIYFKIESEIAVKSLTVFVCSISKTQYFLLVLQCSKSIIHQSKWCICHMTWPISWPTFKHCCFHCSFSLTMF